jgi:hypothetical protein
MRHHRLGNSVAQFDNLPFTNRFFAKQLHKFIELTTRPAISFDDQIGKVSF